MSMYRASFTSLDSSLRLFPLGEVVGVGNTERPDSDPDGQRRSVGLGLSAFDQWGGGARGGQR